MAKVSIIIPTYNRAHYIQRAINSVINQTFKDWEIIVVDDGSTDNTKEILEQYDGKIVYISQKNRGISASRNKGIEVARGEYIAFLDSDDEWVPGKLAIQIEILEGNPKLGIVCSKMTILDDNGNQCGTKPKKLIGRNFKELIKFGGDLPTSTVMTRKACFDKVGVFDEALPPMEDFEMWVRISSEYDVMMLPEKILAYYYRHNDQITSDKTLVYEGVIKFHKKILQRYRHLPDVPIDLINRKIAENQYWLSRIYYKQKKYSIAWSNVSAALSRQPNIGNLFINEKDGIYTKMLKVIKPYVYVLVCLMRFGIQKLTFKNKDET